jgi:histidinol dehydrogenase
VRGRLRYNNKQVGPICAAVQKDGDKAVKSYTSKFDKVELEEIVVKLAVRAGGMLHAARTSHPIRRHLATISCIHTHACAVSASRAEQQQQ